MIRCNDKNESLLVFVTNSFLNYFSTSPVIGACASCDLDAYDACSSYVPCESCDSYALCCQLDFHVRQQAF